MNPRFLPGLFKWNILNIIILLNYSFQIEFLIHKHVWLLFVFIVVRYCRGTIDLSSDIVISLKILVVSFQ